MQRPVPAEAMNVVSNHPKLRATLRFAETLFVAGTFVTGKLEVECKAERNLAMGVVCVELFGVEELTSRDHSAKQLFLHVERTFQGPGLPPSNAVRPYPDPGESILPLHYYYTRRGTTTFLFRLPLPRSSPSSINFGSGLAQVKYEVRATVGVIWKGTRQLVTDKRAMDVAESYWETPGQNPTESIAVGENGKFWMQGRIIGDVLVPGEPACIELTVKNHSAKKNSGLSVTLTRELVLPNIPPSQRQPLQISDTLTSVTFRGPEYIIQPGVEGLASLVFDVPAAARSVKAGPRDGDHEENRSSLPALFEVRCVVTVKLPLGIGSKDMQLDLPVRLCHPAAIPPNFLAGSDAVALPPAQPDVNFSHPASPEPYFAPTSPPNPYGLPPISPSFGALPLSPSTSPLPYLHHGQIWIPPPISSPVHFALSPNQHQYIPMMTPPVMLPPRPSSAQPFPSSPFYSDPSAHLPPPALQPPVPLDWTVGPQTSERTPEREAGKGERATRVSNHLRLSSRHRSVSPQAHRYALPEVHPVYIPEEQLATPHSAVPRHVGLLSPQTPTRTPSHDSPNVSPSSTNVLSPRPQLSPRQTVSVDPFTHVTLSKSERVQTLERIAAVTDAANGNMSGSVPDLLSYQDKTLPGPPVPSDRTKPAIGDARPRVDTVFPLLDEPDLDVAPPTPTLAAVSSPIALRSVQGSTGLDALEARLLAEVGTRKVEANNRKPDVRAVLPIAIPRPMDVTDLPVDSAISSLSLPSLGGNGNEGTLKLGADSRPSTRGSRRGRSPSRPPPPLPRVQSKKLEHPIPREAGSRKVGSEVMKEKEHHRLRKAAQGRITAWLGSIDPDGSPQSGTPPSTTVTLPQDSAETALTSVAPEVKLNGTTDVPTTERGNNASTDHAPNPRSSGFMPLRTLKESSSVSGAAPPENALRQLPRGVVFPPRLVQSDVHYDVRSARGGRGGKVTAVAAIWAAGGQGGDITPVAQAQEVKPAPFRAPPVAVPHDAAGRPNKVIAKPLKSPPLNTKLTEDVPPRRARAIKANSVPAAISSSLAIPTLSSTASLARPPRVAEKSSTIQEVDECVTAPPPAKAPPKTELAFGQARLRELIRKYQG